MARILLTQAIHPQVHARLAASAEVRVAPDVAPDTLRRCAEGCEVVVVRAPLPDDLFDAAPTLIGAVRHGVGVDMIPLEAATRRGVLVANAPGTNAGAVAEHVLHSLIHLSRRRQMMAAEFAAAAPGAWARARAFADQGHELAGRTLGLVGFGHVGQAIARIAGPGLGMEVLAFSRSPLPESISWARRVELAELLQASDAVVLACPLTPQTRGLIGAAQFALMRPGALLVNVARGPVVVEADLVDALRSGRLAGAALDVFDTQPLPEDHVLLRLPQVLVTPHAAGISDDSMLRMGQVVAQAVEELLAGRMPAHCLNPEAGPAFQARFAARPPIIENTG